MESYLISDIIYKILSYLRKDDSFNFLNICTTTSKNKHFLYNKYIFDHKALVSTNKFAEYINSVYVKIGLKNLTLNKLTLSNLTSIEFYSSNKMLFDIDILKYLPTNLKTLAIISDEFNQPLNSLPHSLKTLHIDSARFNKSLNALPNGLINLYVNSRKFNKSLCYLPLTLKCVILLNKDMNFKNENKINLSYLINVTNLKIRSKFLESHPFPPNLEELQICYTYVSDTLNLVSDSLNKMINGLPTNLKSFKIADKRFNYPLNNLPATLECLILNCVNFNQSLDKLPNNLKTLKLCCGNYVQQLDKLPTTLLELHMDLLNFNNVINLPNNLKILRMTSECYNHIIYSFPETIEILSLQCPKLDQNLFELPTNLNEIMISTRIYTYTNVIKDIREEFYINCNWIH